MIKIQSIDLSTIDLPVNVVKLKIEGHIDYIYKPDRNNFLYWLIDYIKLCNIIIYICLIKNIFDKSCTKSVHTYAVFQRKLKLIS